MLDVYSSPAMASRPRSSSKKKTGAAAAIATGGGQGKQIQSKQFQPAATGGGAGGKVLPRVALGNLTNVEANMPNVSNGGQMKGIKFNGGGMAKQIATGKDGKVASKSAATLKATPGAVKTTTKVVNKTKQKDAKSSVPDVERYFKPGPDPPFFDEDAVLKSIPSPAACLPAFWGLKASAAIRAQIGNELVPDEPDDLEALGLAFHDKELDLDSFRLDLDGGGDEGEDVLAGEVDIDDLLADVSLDIDLGI